MEFRVLGPVEVTENGRRLTVASGRQLALLALLVIHANRVVSTERIIDSSSTSSRSSSRSSRTRPSGPAS